MEALVNSLSTLFGNLSFIFQRLDWKGVIDIALVTLVFFVVLQLLRETQAIVLLRGMIFVVVLLSLLASAFNLPAFSWLISTTLPALLFAIPVIFAPEIRRALVRLGRGTMFTRRAGVNSTQYVVDTVVQAVTRLADLRYGALLVLQRADSLDEYAQTGVLLEAHVTPQLLLQIFFPNTPLHDGAVIIRGAEVVAAACVMPLSASGILIPTADRQMGLRHRAALGISEVSDALAVVVSEETGAISIAHGGRMIRRLDAERLENILRAFYLPAEKVDWRKSILRFFSRSPVVQKE
jgi:diadenylate cyclase